MKTSHRARWTAALGIVVSGAFLWWALRHVPLDEVIDNLVGVRWPWLLACIATATATFALRALRWRYLLQLEGAPLPFGPLWHATAVGFMVNNVVGARTGEIARPFMLSRMTGVRFTSALASVGVERILDGMTLVAFLLIATAAGGFDPETRVGGVTLGSAATGAATLFGGMLAVSLAVVRWPRPALRLAERVLHRLMSESAAQRLHGMIEGMIEGLSALATPGRAAPVLLWSIIHWAVAALSWWFGFRAFGITAPWTAALMVQALLAFGVAIPAAPGFFGVFEKVVQATLILYGISETAAVSLAIGYHLSTWVPITALGFWSLARAGLRIGDLRGDGRREAGDGDGD